MATAAWLLRVWQEHAQVTLTPDSKNRFMTSPEILPLKNLRELDLELGARYAIRAYPDRPLLLADWLTFALAAQRQREAAEEEARAQHETAEREARVQRETAEQEARAQREANAHKMRQRAQEEERRRLEKARLKKIRDAEDDARLRVVPEPTESEREARRSLICHGRPRNSHGRCNSCGSQAPLQ